MVLKLLFTLTIPIPDDCVYFAVLLSKLLFVLLYSSANALAESFGAAIAGARAADDDGASQLGLL